MGQHRQGEGSAGRERASRCLPSLPLKAASSLLRLCRGAEPAGDVAVAGAAVPAPLPAPHCAGSDPGCLHPDRQGYSVLRHTPQNRPRSNRWAHLSSCYFLLSRSQARSLWKTRTCQSEGALSQRAPAGGQVGPRCWNGLSAAPWLGGTPRLGRCRCRRWPASSPVTPPKYLPPWAGFPMGCRCLAESQFATLFSRDVSVSPGRKLLLTQILNTEASPFFCNECKISGPRSSLRNRTFCQRSVNITPRCLSGEVTSWLWSFSECAHGYSL